MILTVIYMEELSVEKFSDVILNALRSTMYLFPCLLTTPIDFKMQFYRKVMTEK